ncbi:MAG: pantoate--beta-alanine ligase, partial [Ferruginibacter sp.]
MILIKSIHQASSLLAFYRLKKRRIGFVPTMGALHTGHMALIQNCKSAELFCVCSIFINPTQFNNEADFKKYPVSLEADIDMLEEAGCDVLFLPSKQEIYPDGFIPPKYDLGYLETILEGKYRPGHFQGVCQVVDKLLSIIKPDQLFLGQKDYQQCMVIKKLVSLKNYKLELKIVPTVRENNGLA